MAAVVVAGDEVFRWGMERLLQSVPDVGVVHGCESPQELDALLSRTHLDVVVVTVATVPWLDGVGEVLAGMDAAILVVADHAGLADDDLLAELSTRSFARLGVLWQPTLTADGLQEVLRQCRRGQVTMPPELVQALLARSAGAARRARPGPANLTGREREALTLLVQGMSNKQIARRLSISSHGAKRLVTSIMLKLDVPNRTMAAVTAIRSGIVDAGLPENGSTPRS